MNERLIVALLAGAALFANLAPVEAQTEDISFPPPTWNNPPTESVSGVEHETFQSAVVGEAVGYNILLPPTYESDLREYPVVYFLHGLSGNENSATGLIAPILLKAIAGDALPPMIVVWVNGPALSFYTDSPDGDVPAETVFITELIPHIDATYRTIGDRQGRAIEGMSMGGFGALALAMKHADLFGSVVAYAPALVEVQRRDDGLLTLARAGGTHDGARMPSERLLALSRIQFVKMFGGEPEVFERNSPWGLLHDRAARLRSELQVRIVIGTDDGLWNANQLFHERMVSQEFEHDFVVVPNVGHNLTDLYVEVGFESLAFHADAGGWR